MPEGSSVVDNKVTVGTPQVKNSTEAVRERSLGEDLEDFALGRMDFEQSPHVVGHVDQTKIGRLVSKIAVFYGAPQRALDNGLKAEIFIINDDSFIRYAEESMAKARLKDEIENLSIENEIKELIKEEAQITDGLYLATKSGKEIILIREKSGIGRDGAEIHETLHVMAQDEEGKSSGFEKGGQWTDINEATTEILTLHFQHQNLDVGDLYLKVYSGEIKCGFQLQVKAMLLMMLMTKNNGKPFTFNELARHYFHDTPVENNEFVRSLIDQISSRVPPGLQAETLGCLRTDLYRY